MSSVRIEIITEFSYNIVGDELQKKFYKIIIKDKENDRLITTEVLKDDIDWAIIERYTNTMED